MGMVNFLQRNYVCSSRSKIPFKIRLNCSTGSALLNEGGGSYFVLVMSGTQLFLSYIQACCSLSARLNTLWASSYVSQSHSRYNIK